MIKLIAKISRYIYIIFNCFKSCNNLTFQFNFRYTVEKMRISIQNSILDWTTMITSCILSELEFLERQFCEMKASPEFHDNQNSNTSSLNLPCFLKFLNMYSNSFYSVLNSKLLFLLMFFMLPFIYSSLCCLYPLDIRLLWFKKKWMIVINNTMIQMQMSRLKGRMLVQVHRMKKCKIQQLSQLILKEFQRHKQKQ